MEAILRWLAGLLASILERYADPALEGKLSAYQDKVLAAEAKEKEAQEAERESAIAYDASIRSRNEWQKLLTESQAKESELEANLRASQDRIAEINEQTHKAKEVLAAKSDADVLRDSL